MQYLLKALHHFFGTKNQPNMASKNKSRRDFIKTTAVGAAGLAIPISASSYSRIIGANDRINMAVAGINGRGRGHIYAAKALNKYFQVTALCDVDSRVFDKVRKEFPDYLTSNTKNYTDVRKLLENKDIDVLSIATPDHWHAPMAIMAMNAGKHVFLEKPCSHNPQEGEWLMEVQKSTGKVLQIGNQQRSAPTSQAVIRDIKEGIIGKAYYGKAWYANTRGSIGIGKAAKVPEWLDWELFQGPAPRREFKDNIVHYNWHWFWNWGTGEINNNGLHEMDICRWALGVDFPNEVSSSGGRYCFEDDWQFYDTQVANFQFEGGKMITWEGRSCNGHAFFGKGRGATIHGTKGTVMLDRGGYEVYDKSGKLVKKENERSASATLDVLGIGGLDNLHMYNFMKAIQEGTRLNSPIDEAHKSTLLCHLGNMSQKFNKTLKIDTKTGKPQDKEAMTLWSREYEEGWKPV